MRMSDKRSQQANSLRLIVLGDGAVGKSCMTIRFTRSQFVDDYDPTIEDAYKKQCVIDGQPAMLDILDTAGQEEYSSMREQYMHTGDGFLCVYSITSADTLSNISKLVRQILRVKDADKFPIVLVGNKCDLENDRQVTYDDGQRLAEELGGLPFLETSAKLGINVDKAFYELVRTIRKHQQGKVTTPPKKKKKSCTLL